MIRRLLFASTWILLCSAARIGAPAAQPMILEPGTSFELGLHTHQKHRYQLEARAGQLVRLRVLQEGIDLYLEIQDERGEPPLLTVDSRNRDNGWEELWWIPAETRSYRLVICPWPGSARGSYRLELSPFRDPTPADALRARAVLEIDRSRSHPSLPLPERTCCDVNRLERALDLWQKAEEPIQEGMTWLYWADSFKKRAQHRQALVGYQRALELFAKHEAKLLEIDSLSAIGQSFRTLGAFEKARQAHEDGLRLAVASGDRRLEAAFHNNLGVVHQSRGQLRQALQAFRSALTIFEELQHRSKQASPLFGLGQTYSLLGRRREAMEMFQKTYLLAKTSSYERIEALSLGEIGRLLALEEKVDAARAHYHLALEIHRRNGWSYPEAGILHGLGKLGLQSGDPESASSHLAQALSIFRSSDAPRDHAHVLLSLSELEITRGQLEQAANTSRKALRLLEPIGDREGILYAHYLIGRTLDARGDLTGAVRELETALGIVEDMRKELANEALGLPFYDVRQLVEDSLRSSLVRHDRLRPGQGYRERAFEIGETVRARGLRERMTARADPSTTPSPDVSGSSRDLYSWSTGQELLANEDTLQRVVQIAEKRAVRVRASEASSSHSRLDIVSLREIQGKLLDPETVMLIYHLGHEEGELWILTDQEIELRPLPGRREITKRVDALSQWLFNGFKREFRRVIRLRLQSLSEILLGPAVEAIGSGKRIVIVTDGELHRVPFAALPKPGSGTPLVRHHEIVRLPSASVLSHLRERAADRQPPQRFLALVADPVFDAEDSRLGPEGRATEPVDAGFGEPERALRQAHQDSGIDRLERLRGTRVEARAIRALAEKHIHELGRSAKPGVLEALGLEANRELVTSGALASYGILHFATHAFNHPRHPDLSGLVLSMVDETGAPENGFLRSYEIEQLHLPAELVVLSACETATGRLHAEGPASLARSFLNAGATRVVVSLWKVDDQASAELMSHFYRALFDGSPPATALRLAQLEMLGQERYQSPFFWAGFELQGDWRQL